ncbi:patatin-like phospholipase family protein [bacterium]|nr:patatin-like phospholipase family protein [bacterium]MBU1989627.1 patatin-like phospholipase family protein [bacterium]
MKLFLIVAVLASCLLAEGRPKIALVLSGGGARGGAHVGVLKVLQENKIPIDMIVGTSMGSFVGGLYASGRTPDEIEQMLVRSNWKEHIRTDFNRVDIPLRRKQNEYYYQGKIGLGIDTDNTIVLPTGVLKRQPLLLKFLKETQHAQNIEDFDDFYIPFRAVATNIKNGETVVLKSGNIAKAIYASSSIPGGLQPINIDGVDLVDGGVSSNIPIDVAKEMGADIIIAVDVSEDFSEDLKVDSYFVVMGQLVNILMRKNANESISALSKNDILITPDLEGFSGLDADKYSQIIHKGYSTTQEIYEDKLKHLSLSDSEYEEYAKKFRDKKQFKSKRIDEIRIENSTYINDNSILNRLRVQRGSELDEDKLREDLLHIYNMMIFDSVEYVVKNENAKNVLIITTTPSWDNHGEIRFALGLEDDFQGHSSYSLKIGYTMFGLNEYGGEWKNDLQIGKRRRAYTEIFQALDEMQRYYVRPSLVYQQWVNLIPASTLSIAPQGSVELGLKRYGAGLGIGTHIGTDYELEFGISAFKDFLEIELLNDVPSENQARPVYASVNIDNLDNIHFPKVGLKSKFVWTKDSKFLRSDYEYEQFYFELEKPLTLWANNLSTYLKYGNTYKNEKTALAGTFSLGGLFNLSGYAPYSLSGDNMMLGVLRYRYELKDGGFFGALNAPLFFGFSLEAGNAWNKGDELNYDIIKKSGTLYIAADTFFGPFYLAYGVTDAGEQSGYLYLGEKF